MTKRLLVSIALTLWLAAQAVIGAVYYVDYDGGDDSNSGTSSGSPFKRCPGDDSATGTADSTTLTAGDTVIFKGGVNYVGMVDLDWSGSSGSPIIYDGNSAGTFGTGRAVFNPTNHPTIIRGMRTTGARQWLVITNIHFKEFGGYPDEDPAGAGPLASKTGYGIDMEGTGGSSNLVIAACLFEEIGEWRNKTNFNANTVVGAGIAFENCQNVLLRDCGFNRITYPVGIKADGGKTINMMVSNSWFTSNIIWAIDIAGRTSGDSVSNITVYGCTFTNYHTFSLLTWAGLGSHPHVDGIFLRRVVTSFHTLNNNFVGNYFQGLTGEGGGTASIHISEGPTCNIRSNVFDNVPDVPAIYLNIGPDGTSDPQVVNIEWNTFLSQTAISFNSSPNTLDTVTVRNNIFDFYRTGTGDWFVLNFFDANLPDTFTLDYNIYRTSEDDLSVVFQSGGGGYVTFAELQGGTIGDPFEANGLYDADENYIGFVNRTTPNGDFHLTESSPARGAASDGGDIGAFPYSAGGGGGSSGRAFSSQIGGRSVTFGGKGVQIR